MPDENQNIKKQRVGDLSKRRVLVVDDNSVNCQILKEMLGSWNMDVAAVSGGREALHMLRVMSGKNYSIDCVLLDYQMPDLNGGDVLREMRNDPMLKDIPVVVLSSVDLAEDDHTFRELGADDNLNKPVRAQLLRKTLETVISPQITRAA